MTYMTWTEDLSVKVRAFDNQHKKLVFLINALHDAMKARKGKEILSSVLDELLEYTQTHFVSEEKMMLNYDYPDYLEHKLEHDSFITRTIELKKDYYLGKAAISNEVMKFVQDWVANHILVTDKNYGAFFNRNGVS